MNPKTYKVQPSGDEFEVVSEDGSQSFGTFTTDEVANLTVDEIVSLRDEADINKIPEYFESALVAHFAQLRQPGVNLRVGKLEANPDYGPRKGSQAIQAISFDKKSFDILEARQWLRFNEFWHDGAFMDKAGRLHFELRPEGNFEKNTFKDLEGPASEMSQQDVIDPEDLEEEELFGLKEVEIFRAGKWNGDDYTIADIDAMITAFDQAGYRPPLKFGHEGDREEQGLPALGWVDKIYRKGSRLVADFADMPKEVYRAIKRRAYDAVSAEIYWNLTRDGKVFKRALKAVALLGAEIPAVAGLKPLRESAASEDGTTFEAVHIHSLRPEDFGMDKDKVTKTPEELAAELEAANARIAQLSESNAANQGAALELTALKGTVTELTTRVESAEEAKRKGEIERKVNLCQLPSMHPFLHGCYDMATRAEMDDPDRTYSMKDGDKVNQVSPVAMLDSFVAGMNKLSKHFGEQSIGAGSDSRKAPPQGSNAGVQVDALVKEHAAKNSVSYSVAMAVVQAMPEHKDLFAAYQAS